MSQRRPAHCDDADCHAHRTMDLMGTPHTLDLLYVLVREDARPWRFGEIRERLGMAPNILTDRLRALAALGMVTRAEFAEMPPRVEYAATEDALALADAFREFERWVAPRHRTSTRAAPS